MDRPFGCEKCDSGYKGKVIGTRYTFDMELRDYTVVRRRKCPVCGEKWTTVEVNKREVIKKWLE